MPIRLTAGYRTREVIGKYNVDGASGAVRYPVGVAQYDHVSF